MARRLPPSSRELSQEVASTRDGTDITRPFTAGLRQPADPRLAGAVDWGVYDRIAADDQVFSTFQQRRRAVVACTWSVMAGDEDDARSLEAAERFDATLQRIGWDRITDRMLWAVFHGYSVAEIMWAPRDGLLDFDAIRVRHARRFRFDRDNSLRLLTPGNQVSGLAVPDRKFWVLTSGGSDDDEPYGRGLAEWLYWPTTFKRNGLRFWNLFLDKFSSPTAIGKYRPGTSDADKAKLLAVLGAVATDAGITIPDSMVIELLEAKRSGVADFEQLCRFMDEAIAKVVLSQTMTTQDGSSLSQAQVHAGVRAEVVTGDADLLSDSFNGPDGPARWWTDVNFGADVAAPILRRTIAEEADLKQLADIDTSLKGLGWQRDETSFRDTYGAGYERAAPPAPRRLLGAVPDVAGIDAANDDAMDAVAPRKTASFAFDDPRSLYVQRKLLNADEVIAWARQQGLTTTLRADDMHVTVTWSRRPVNWMKMGGFWGWTGDNSEHLVPAGGPRLVDRIGDAGAVALFFFSGHLEQRHREMRDSGASWDFDGYHPHVTLTYDPGDVDLATIEPYRGELRFGPEIFEPLQEDFVASIRHDSFAEPDGADADPAAVDRLADRALDAARDRITASLIDPLLAAIEDASSAEEVHAILATLPGDTATLAASLDCASFAVALDAEVAVTPSEDE